MSGILVSFQYLEKVAIRKKDKKVQTATSIIQWNSQVGIRLSIGWSIMQALSFPSQKQVMNEAFFILFFNVDGKKGKTVQQLL